jgi:hypothetical protein
MFQALEQGDSIGFFDAWRKHIPEIVLKQDPMCAKLEFYSQMFFAIQPINPHAPRPSTVRA